MAKNRAEWASGHRQLTRIGLIGTGGCAELHYSKKAARIEDCVADGRRGAEEVPQVFTRIHMHFIVTGRGLSSDKVERAITLSADKYCSASAMMAKTADVTHDFEVIDSA